MLGCCRISLTMLSPEEVEAFYKTRKHIEDIFKIIEVDSRRQDRIIVTENRLWKK